MPVYEYQGQHFDIAETDPQKAKAKILAHLGVQEKEDNAPSMLDELKRGTLGTIGAVGDLAVGLGKSAAASLAAPIRTAIYGGADTQRQVAQQAAEDIFKSPSKGIEQLAGLPEGYVQGSLPYKTLMAPFEALSSSVEKVGHGVQELTGSREAGGTAKQLADIALLAAPIPGVKAAKKAGGKLLEPFVKGRDLEAIKAGDTSQLTAKELSSLESLKELETSRAKERKIVQDVEEQLKQEEAVKEAQRTEETLYGQQQELPLTENQFGVKPEELQVDENGIPFNQERSAEVQQMERESIPQQELFTPEHYKQQAVNEAVNTWQPNEESLRSAMPDREYLKQQEIEQAYLQKEQQDRTAPVETEFQPQQASKIMDLPPELRGQQELFSGFDAKRVVEDLNNLFDKVKPKSLDEFILAAKQAGVNQSDNILKMVYEDSIKTKETVQAEQVNRAISKVPGLENKLDIYRDITPETVQEEISRAGDAAQGELGFSRNNLLSRGRLGLETIKNSGLRAGISYMLKLRDNANIEANTMLHGDNGLVRNLRKMEGLFNEGKAWEVLRQRMEAEFNPEYQFRFDREQQKINAQLDKMFESVRTRMEELTGKKIQKIANYFPSMFYGDYVSVVKDADGRVVGYITEKSGNAAKTAGEFVKQELGEGFTVSDPSFRGEFKNQRFRDSSHLANYFDAYAELLGSDDPVVQRAQDSIQRALNKRAMDTRNVKQRMKFKAGVLGAEGRKGWKNLTENYRDSKDVLENYFRGFKEWEANMESAKFLEQVKETNPDAVNTYKTMADYFDDLRYGSDSSLKIMKELESSLANKDIPLLGKRNILGGMTQAQRKTANFLTSNWLGWWNPVAMTQNMLQPLNTLPKLVELATNGGSKDVISPLILGMADGLLDGVQIAGNKFLGKDLSQKTKYMKDFEVIKPGLVEAQNKTKGGHYFNKGVVSGGLLTTEAFARATSFNIFRRYLEASGYDTKTSMEMAKNLTHEYQVNYENYAKAGALSKIPGGELAGKLQSYKINQMTQLANFLAEAKNNKNLAPLVAAIALSIGMTGVSGMIGMDVAEGLHGLAVKTGAVDPQSRSPRQWAMDLGGSLANGIPSQVTGKWLTGSLAFNLVGDMSWRNMAPVVFGAYDAASKVAGVAPRAIKDIVTSEHTLPQSEKYQLASSIVPASLRGQLENRFLTDTEGRISSPYTGEVTYQKGPQDQDLLSRFTNMRSTQRGETIARAQLLKEQNKRIAEKQDAKLKSAQKMVDESIRMNRPLDEKYLQNVMQDLLDLEADPEVAINKINDFVVRNHMGDWLERQIMAGEINLGNVNKKMRAMEQKEKLTK